MQQKTVTPLTEGMSYWFKDKQIHRGASNTRQEDIPKTFTERGFSTDCNYKLQAGVACRARNQILFQGNQAIYSVIRSRPSKKRCDSERHQKGGPVIGVYSGKGEQRGHCAPSSKKIRQNFNYTSNENLFITNNKTDLPQLTLISIAIN